jgi:hypothetical protein
VSAFIRYYAELISPDVCADIVARFEQDARKTRSPATLAIDRFPQWGDVVDQTLAVLSTVTHRYVADCATFGGTHPRVQPTSLVITRHDPQSATSWRSPTVARPRPLVVVAGFLNDSDGGEIEFEAHEVRLVPRAGTFAVFPTGFEYVCRDARAQSARYVVATTLTFYEQVAHA